MPPLGPRPKVGSKQYKASVKAAPKSRTVTVKAHTRSAPKPRPRGQSLTQAPVLPKPPISQKRAQKVVRTVKTPLLSPGLKAPSLVPLKDVERVAKGTVKVKQNKGLKGVLLGQNVHELGRVSGEKSGQTVVYKKGTPERKLQEQVGLGKLDKYEKESVAQPSAPALKLLAQTTRPLHGIAGATNAALKGQNVPKAALRGLENKDKTTFSDVLKTVGVKNKALRAIGGFTGDLFLDPTNYASFGTAAVARKTALEAAEKTAAEEAAGAAAEKAVTNKGLTVGMKFGPKTFKTSGKTTAAISRKTGLSKAATKTRESGAAQTLGKALAPDFTPKEVPKGQFADYRAAKKQKSAAEGIALRHAEARGQAFARALPKEHADVVAHLEGHAVPLSKEGEGAAAQARKEFDVQSRKELKEGVLRSTRPDYVPHQLKDAIENPGVVKRIGNRASGRAVKNPMGEARKYKGTIREINTARGAEGKAPLFSENLPGLVTSRLVKGDRAIADKHFLNTLADHVGTKVPKDLGEVPDTHSVYQIRSTPTKTEPAIKALENKRGELDPEAIAKAQREVGSKVVVLPKVIGRAETKAREIPSDNAAHVLAHKFDRFMAGVKTSLTVLNLPAYDLRNLYGDSFNSFVADTDAKSYVRGWHSAFRQAKLARGEKNLTPAEVQAGKLDNEWKLAEQHGAINTGFFGSEIHALSRATTGGVRKSAARHPVETLRNVGAVRENAIRFGTYLGARRRGLSPADAASWSLKHHIDFGDLTDFEKAFARRAVPFYTWLARNTRLQTTSLVRRPGKYAAVQKVLEEGAKAAGFSSYNQFVGQLPASQQYGAPFPVKVGGKVVPLFTSMPFTDLNRVPITNLRQQADTFMQTINPVVKAAGEEAFNYSTFFRRPIQRSKDAPTAPHWVPAPSFVHLLPSGIRKKFGITKTLDKRSGKMVWSWPAKLDYLVRLSPQSGLVTQLGTPVAGSRGQTGAMRLFAQGTGIRPGQYDPTQLALNKVYDRRSQVQVQLADLRDQNRSKNKDGSYTPAYRKLLDEQNALNKAIYQAQAQQGRKVLPTSGGPPKGGGSGSFGGPSSSGSSFAGSASSGSSFGP